MLGVIFAIALGLLGCSGYSSTEEFQPRRFAGKSGNWLVVLNMPDESTKRYTFSYTRDKKPAVFIFKINDYKNGTIGEGEFNNHEVFVITVSCGNACKPLPKQIPVFIEWEGKTEELFLKEKKSVE